MDVKKLLENFSFNENPVGLGGCKNSAKSFPCCEYNLTIFDNKINEKENVIEFNGEIAKIHHGALDENKSRILIQYDGMKVISDDKWDLQILLSKVNEKKEIIFRDYAKECLIDTLFCITKTKEGIKNSDPFFSAWLKSSGFFLGDAVLAINFQKPAPSHFLEYVRELEKNRVNEKFSTVNEIIGIERAAPSLLSRMCKSTMGLSDIVEGNNNSKIIQAKSEHLVKNSLFADCYFYLCYINRNNFMKIKDSLHRKPELIHLLKIGFDLENDPTKIEQQATILHDAANELLTKLTA